MTTQPVAYNRKSHRWLQKKLAFSPLRALESFRVEKCVTYNPIMNFSPTVLNISLQIYYFRI